uniref:Salutaridinol 7-O-acetyltransferase n=1 Tax=Opuntia streptacantha TaxID=393608 RepID=A0A7C8YSK4_OPUST
MTSFKVEVTSKETIKPSSPTPPHLRNLQLSSLDQFEPSIYIPLLYFYQNEPTQDPIDHSERSLLLKKSLSDILVRFYPLAGRVKDNSFIDCNDEGVEFYEAHVSCNLLDVIEMPNLDDLRRLLPFEPSVHEKNIILGVQVNHFSCGGMAICVCISHKIADGTSAVQFARAWANMARGAQNEGEDHNHVVVNPKFDGASYFTPRGSPNGMRTQEVSISEEKIVTKRFIFDKKMIAALKEQATNTLNGPQLVTTPTRVEVVSAFIWRQIIKAAAQGTTHNPDLAMTSRAFVSVNLRPRMIPPIPDDSSYGNFVWFTVTDFVNIGDPEPEHPELVRMLREAIRKVDDHENYIQVLRRGHESWLANMKKPAKTEIEQRCTITSWCRFPVYEVNFGWGRPTWVCTVTNPFKNVAVLLSTRCGEGIEAWISTTEEDMAFLERDLEFQ